MQEAREIEILPLAGAVLASLWVLEVVVFLVAYRLGRSPTSNPAGLSTGWADFERVSTPLCPSGARTAPLPGSRVS